MKNMKPFLIALALVAVAQAGLAGIPPLPDLTLSEAYISYAGPEMVTLLVVPDGSGPAFTEARDSAGNSVDATITLVLCDALGDVTTMAHYPNEDLWLEFPGGEHLPTCAAPVRGLIADDFTDDMGTTHWIEAPQAGGYNEGPAMVFINNSQLESNAGLAIRFNSPDINGDLSVNLTDVSIFSGDYYSEYQFRSDILADGVVNLSDIALFATYYGAGCP